MGARPLRRAIESVEDQLAENILFYPDKGGNWLVTVKNDEFILVDQGPPTNDGKENLTTTHKKNTVN